MDFFCSFQLTGAILPLLLALGLHQWDLADQHGVHQSAVSEIVSVLKQYFFPLPLSLLFFILGACRIWMSQDKINERLPAKVQNITQLTPHSVQFQTSTSS